MIDARERIAGVLCECRAVDNWLAQPCDYDTADAILAAMPEIVGAMVKPLVWLDYPMGSRCKTDHDYSINYWEQEGLFVDAYTTMRRHTTLEAAKQAANDHHRAQLLGALGLAK